ncbi:MAG: KpsF/GutQ family sugar-phosphate isomerase [Phycisphaerales bacterium]
MPRPTSSQQEPKPTQQGRRAELDAHDLDAEREFIRGVLRDEARAVAALADQVGAPFHEACDRIEACAEQGGTVLVSGLGKSGLVGAKISATFASLGIPSHPVHPTEAAHGDLGRFRAADVVICLSHSGETDEVVALAASLKQDGLPVIAITRGAAEGEEASRLERIAEVTLAALVRDEAGGEFMAPTCSTTAAMAIGDALALAVARRRNFTHEDFAKRHPGGQLGGMLRPVTELLRFRAGVNLPLVDPATSVEQALNEADRAGRRPGALLVVEHDRLVGIFTDGDLRRLVLRNPEELKHPMREVMTRGPRTIRDTALARDAVAAFREHRQDEIPVVDAEGRPVGLLDVQDLITMRLVRD